MQEKQGHDLKPLAALLAEANTWLLAGNLQAAKRLLLDAAPRHGCPADAILRLAEIEIADREMDQATARLKNLAADTNATGSEMIHDEIDFLLARAEHAQGQIGPALERVLALKRRLASVPPPVFTLLGQLYFDRGNFAAAVNVFREAVEAQSVFAPHYLSLAVALFRGDQLEAAVQAVEVFLKLSPHSAEGWELSGDIHQYLASYEKAVTSYQRAIACDPARSSARKRLARFLIQYWRYREADACLQEMCQRVPDDPDLPGLSGLVKEELGEVTQAIDIYAAAMTRGTARLQVVLGRYLALPQIYASVEDLMQWRQRYRSGLDMLEQNREVLLQQANEIYSLQRSNFLLAYQGENDRDLQQRYSTLIGALADKAMPASRIPKEITFDGRRKLRVGFYGSLFRNCTAGYYFERWITALSADHFERFVYYSGPVIESLTTRISTKVEHFIRLQADVRGVAARLHADELDILVYPEIGMGAMTYLLATLRLAPVQCVGWGHPVTSGSEAIDYFVTCAAMEPSNATEHYVERLVTLPGIGVDYALPEPVSLAQRTDFGLPEMGRLYFCPQSLFKIHPEMDELFADIVQADPQATLVLFQASSRSVTEKLGLRIQRCFVKRGIAPRGQLKFLPRLDPVNFRRALSLADVVLDTVRWSGGNTSLDALACGVPIVTWPGNLMRSRQTAAMLGLMQLDGLVVDSAPAYIKTSIEVATNKDLNHQCRQLIAERRMQVFNCTKAISAWSNALFMMATGLRCSNVAESGHRSLPRSNGETII